MSPKLLNTLLILASVVLYYVVMGPLWSGNGNVWAPEKPISKLIDDQKQYDSAVSKAEELFTQGKELKTQYANVGDATKEKMLQMVPQSIDPPRLLNEVMNISYKSNVGLTGLNYTDVGSVDALRGAYEISFGLKTTYTRFKEIMRNFDTSLRLYTLQSVSFSAPGDDGLITFQVRLRTYYLK